LEIQMILSAEAQMRILNLYKGQPTQRAEHALAVAEGFARNRQCSLKIRLVGIKIGS